MALGFLPETNFERLVGWELYQVTIDKYHVMFFFNQGHNLLNVADRFSCRSADGKSGYTYEIYGEKHFLDVDSILRKVITKVEIASREELKLVFENGDTLSIFDNPDFRSWWFQRCTEAGSDVPLSDRHLDDLTEDEIAFRSAAIPGGGGD